MMSPADAPSPAQQRTASWPSSTPQLTRWLDAGGPAAPLVEDTLAQLPRRARHPRPSWSKARAESKAKKAGLDAAREQSKGKTLDQLKELITTEYSARGIEIAPSMVDMSAGMLHLDQRPFGRARSALKAIRMLKSGGGDVIRLIKNGCDDEPAWLRPPDRATYPVIADRHRYTAVELDAGARTCFNESDPTRDGAWARVSTAT